jgi:hypothetical protein
MKIPATPIRNGAPNINAEQKTSRAGLCAVESIGKKMRTGAAGASR